MGVAEHSIARAPSLPRPDIGSHTNGSAGKCLRQHEGRARGDRRDPVFATSAHAPHADGSVRPKLGVLAEDPEAASTGAATTAPRPALPQ
jgi:hypothetical protein